MKKLGFGCMRLKMDGDKVDYEAFSKQIKDFLDAGFIYFDTAHGYLGGLSEIALRDCLTSKYPRESYLLADKLSSSYIKTAEDVIPFFHSQLEITGVDYFDYYLIHAVNRKNYDLFTSCRAFEQALQLKQEGKIRHLGFSFHDNPEFLEKVLTEHPEVEFVQLQLNYLDYDDPRVCSDECYQVCEKHGKGVVVMEPVKGGSLADLPTEGRKVLDALNGGSYASYAVRFAASYPNVFMVLSGMNSIEQMRDNLSYMKDFVPFNEAEYVAVAKVRSIIRATPQIACTGCSYCVEGCPMGIPIPDVFAAFNQKMRFSGSDADAAYVAKTQGKGKASECVKCGQCEQICPQNLAIRGYLEDCAEKFEK